MSIESKDSWIHIQLERKQERLIVHSQEKIEGVLFLVTSEFDEHNKLTKKYLVRGDLVKC